jgi:hypothetical protein
MILGEQGDQTGRAARGGAIGTDQPARRAWTGAHRGVDHVGKADVAGELGGAVDLGGKVEPGQSLAGQPIVDAAADREIFGKRLGGSLPRQLAEAQPVVAAKYEAAGRVEALPVGVPACGGGLHQQGARARAGLAHPQLEGARRGRAAGQDQSVAGGIFARQPAARAAQEFGRTFVGRRLRQQAVGVERADRRRFDGDCPPVGAELVGEDLRKARPAALAELGLGNRDDDAPVLADLQEGVEEGFARRCAQVRTVGARPEGPGEQKADSGAPADQQLPPADAPSFASRHAGLIEGRGRWG